MTSTAQFEEALALALKLSAKEKMQLIGQVAASVERDIAIPESTSSPEQSEESHWGKNLLRLLDEIGPVELDHPEIEDPVEWVKQIRRDQDKLRGLDWGDDE
jgi:hypothetical protein